MRIEICDICGEEKITRIYKYSINPKDLNEMVELDICDECYNKIIMISKTAVASYIIHNSDYSKRLGINKDYRDIDNKGEKD